MDAIPVWYTLLALVSGLTLALGTSGQVNRPSRAYDWLVQLSLAVLLLSTAWLFHRHGSSAQDLDVIKADYFLVGLLFGMWSITATIVELLAGERRRLYPEGKPQPEKEDSHAR